MDIFIKFRFSFIYFYVLITFVNLILSIIIRKWRAKDLIKTDKKNAGNSISKACIALSIILLALSYIEDFSFKESIDNAKMPCQYTINYPTNYFCNNLYKQYQQKIRRLESLEPCPSGQTYIQPLRIIDFVMGYASIYFMQILSYIGFGIWLILKGRIDNKLDGPEKEKIFIKENVETLCFLRDQDNSNIIVYNNKNNNEQNKIIINEIRPEIVDTQRADLKKNVI